MPWLITFDMFKAGSLIMMTEREIVLSRLQDKIQRLGEAKIDLAAQVVRMKEELESLYKINRELQSQVAELSEKLNENIVATSLPVADTEHFRLATKQRISDLVKEIDDCIALLNK
jgi:predicted  nucleic acid-binding Zn-ribbon protein